MKVVLALGASDLQAPPPTPPPSKDGVKSAKVLPPRSKAPGRPNVLEPPELWQGRENHLPNVVRVSYDRKIRRITLQRYLLSKLCHDPESMTWKDLVVLYDNQLWCEEKARHDPLFQDKHREHLSAISASLKETRFSFARIQQNIERLSTSLVSKLHGFIFPVRNMTQLERHLKGRTHLLPPKSLGTDVKKLPPPRYIGVGYKDKGTARDPAWDGSPRWQDVASKEVVDGRVKRQETRSGTDSKGFGPDL